MKVFKRNYFKDESKMNLKGSLMSLPLKQIKKLIGPLSVDWQSPRLFERLKFDCCWIFVFLTAGHPKVTKVQNSRQFKLREVFEQTGKLLISHYLIIDWRFETSKLKVKIGSSRALLANGVFKIVEERREESRRDARVGDSLIDRGEFQLAGNASDVCSD